MSDLHSDCSEGPEAFHLTGTDISYRHGNQTLTEESIENRVYMAANLVSVQLANGYYTYNNHWHKQFELKLNLYTLL